MVAVAFSRPAGEPGTRDRSTRWAMMRAPSAVLGPSPPPALAASTAASTCAGVDVAVLAEVSLEHLGPLLRRQVVHWATSSRSLSQTSTTTVWSASGPTSWPSPQRRPSTRGQRAAVCDPVAADCWMGPRGTPPPRHRAHRDCARNAAPGCAHRGDRVGHPHLLAVGEAANGGRLTGGARPGRGPAGAPTRRADLGPRQ